MKSTKNNMILKINSNDLLKNIVNKDNMYTIPVFIPHFGCQNECIFCNQRKITGNIACKSLDEVKNEIDEALSHFNTKKTIQIAFFGGSFTGISISSQIEYLKLANEYIAKGLVESIRISTRPDYINVKILKILKKYNVKTIELGVQSMDEEVLKIAKRGHTSLDVIRAARLINLFNFELGFQVMIGLPKSTIETEKDTIKKLLKYNPKQLRIYPVYVLKESKLYDMYESKEYIPITVEEAANRSAEIIKLTHDSDVKIIRIGLQSTSEICAKNLEIKGPVCDNFAEYALSKIIRDYIEEFVEKNNLKNKILIIKINSRYFSLVSGPLKCNRIYFEKKYGLKIKLKGE